MKKIVLICLLALSVNSVLIQTLFTDNTLLKNGIRVAILLIMAASILLMKKPILIGLFVLMDVSLILLGAKQNIDQLTFIFMFVLVQALLFIESKKLEKYLLISSCVALLLVFIFLWSGITHNNLLTWNDRNRMTYGTDGVPFFYNLVYGCFSLLFVYSKKHFVRFKWLITLICLGFTTYFYTTTNLRGGFISFLALVFLSYVIPLTKKIGILRIFFALIPVISLVVSFLIASFHDNESINLLFSLRPTLLNNFFGSLNITDYLFSDSVKALDGTNIIDNSYLHLLVGGGLLINLAIEYLFFKATLNLYKKKKYVDVAFLIATCLYFNMESLLIRVENMFVIYFWYLMIKYSMTKVEELDSEVVNQTENIEPVKKRRRFKKYKIVW